MRLTINCTPVTRTDLGLPENWLWIENWLNDFEDVVQEAQEDSPPIELKNRESPILSSYDNGASKEFWSAFPKNYNSKLQKTVNNNPIREFVDEPPIFPTTIISDAAGAALEWIDGKSVNKTIANDRGVAPILHQGGKALKTATMSWPGNLLMGQKNINGCYFGTKRGTLEAVGLILPFISYPTDLIGQKIVLQVDNTSLIYGWEKHYCKNDAEKS
jgi:hypothetical protein